MVRFRDADRANPAPCGHDTAGQQPQAVATPETWPKSGRMLTGDSAMVFRLAAPRDRWHRQYGTDQRVTVSHWRDEGRLRSALEPMATAAATPAKPANARSVLR